MEQERMKEYHFLTYYCKRRITPELCAPEKRRYNRTGGRQYMFISQREVVEEKKCYTFTSRVGANRITRTGELPLMKFKYNACPECGNEYYEYDPHHAESFCPKCGVVLEEPTTIINASTTERGGEYKGLTREEKAILARRGRYNINYTRMKDWRTFNDTRMIKTITSQVGLNVSQKDLVFDIIMGVSFKYLHRRLSKENIIIGVSRYVLKISGVHSSMLRYTGMFSNISKREYEVIESNIEHYFQ